MNRKMKTFAALLGGMLLTWIALATIVAFQKPELLEGVLGGGAAFGVLMTMLLVAVVDAFEDD